MDTTVTIQISALVAIGVQGIKLFGFSGRAGMVMAVVLSFLIVAIYAFSHETQYLPKMLWDYTSAFMVVAGTSIGIHSAIKNTGQAITEKRQAIADTIDPKRFDGPDHGNGIEPGTGTGTGTGTGSDK